MAAPGAAKRVSAAAQWYSPVRAAKASISSAAPSRMRSNWAPASGSRMTSPSISRTMVRVSVTARAATNWRAVRASGRATTMAPMPLP